MATLPASRPVLSNNRATEVASQFSAIGASVLRYGLALVLIWIGLLKFQPYEQAAVMPLIAHSPFISWMLGAFGLTATASIVGSYEILAGFLIVARPFAARLSALGGLLAVGTFLVTTSFLFTTPAMAVYAPGASFPFLGMIGQFLAKDIVLLGAAIYITGEAWLAPLQPRRGVERAT